MGYERASPPIAAAISPVPMMLMVVMFGTSVPIFTSSTKLGVPEPKETLMNFRPSWSTNQMMCAIGVDLGLVSSPTTARSHVPIHASFVDAGFFYRTRPLICSAPV
jgi:hypothetical protein